MMNKDKIKWQINSQYEGDLFSEDMCISSEPLWVWILTLIFISQEVL